MDAAGLKHKTVTTTVPVTFLGDLHSELSDSVFRDVIGHFYYGQNFPPELEAEIRALGFNPEQFLTNKSGD